MLRKHSIRAVLFLCNITCCLKYHEQHLAPEHKINANNWWKQNNTQILTILLMYKIKMKRFFLSETNVSIPCYSIELPVRPTLVNPIFLPIYTINGTCDMEGGYGGHHKKTNIMVKYYSLSFEKKKKRYALNNTQSYIKYWSQKYYGSKTTWHNRLSFIFQNFQLSISISRLLINKSPFEPLGRNVL